MAMGLINTNDATRPDFYRGSGINATHGPRNTIEFNYFPPTQIDPTISTVLVSSDNQILVRNNFPLELLPERDYEVEMVYSAAEQTLRLRMTEERSPFGLPPDNTLRELKISTQFSDFQANAFAIINYNEGGQSPAQFQGSILAHGIIDDVRLRVPAQEPLILDIERSYTGIQIRFDSMPGNFYQLQYSTNLSDWINQGELLPGSGEPITIDQAADNPGFYRVRIF